MVYGTAESLVTEGFLLIDRNAVRVFGTEISAVIRHWYIGVSLYTPIVSRKKP